MSDVLTQARKEWGLIRESPMADVRKPSDAAPRDRGPSKEEMERLLLSAGSDLTKSTTRVRPIALNRKNALFAGHDAGARSRDRAVIASLIETCKMNGVYPPGMTVSHAHRHRPRPQAKQDRRPAPMELCPRRVISTPLTDCEKGAQSTCFRRRWLSPASSEVGQLTQNALQGRIPCVAFPDH